jgi:hydroxyethylthiazole kinase-like uncharacterized protein yjeF
MHTTPLYTAEQCRELDLLTIRSGVPGYELMCRAGKAALQVLQARWPDCGLIQVLCGGGNNGGDGWVLARLAQQLGMPAVVYVVGDEAVLQGEAREAWLDAKAAGVTIKPFHVEQRFEPGVVVDALLGTGVKNAVREPMAQAVQWINNSGLPVLALDVPSGICANSGSVLGVAVKADVTLMFIARKRGLYMGDALDYTGEKLLDTLAVAPAIYAQLAASLQVMSYAGLLTHLPRRLRNAHKGHFGHVLIIGGAAGMAGAALMAATAAARCGAGLVSVATLPEHVAALAGVQPELMIHGVAHIHELQALLENASVVVVGPGLGQSPWAEQMLYKAYHSGKPTVLDADALNLLAQGQVASMPVPGQCVITPHPGEAARLLKTTTDRINADRVSAAQQLHDLARAVVVLKGAGTLVATDADIRLCDQGNPGMASGGMGDVLSGVIAALVAQGLAPEIAAQLAVVVHAKAADKLAAQHGERGLLASDLIPVMRSLLNAA